MSSLRFLITCIRIFSQLKEIAPPKTLLALGNPDKGPIHTVTVTSHTSTHFSQTRRLKAHQLTKNTQLQLEVAGFMFKISLQKASGPFLFLFYFFNFFGG